MFRFVCLSLFLSSSTSLHKPASQWDSRLGSLTSRSSWFSSWTQSQLLFRLKTWTMRNVKLTACSNNFSLSTSLRNLKLESSHHQSASLYHLDSCSYLLPQSWVSSVYECLRTIPYTHTIQPMLTPGCMRTRPSSLGTLLALPSSLPKGGKDLGVEMLITFTCCCSTATQTIQFLNDLYNKFDKAIDNYDVYKVWRVTESNL